MRITPCLEVFPFVFAALFVASRASAATPVQLDANLDPFQEVPPHNTPAFGSADFTLDNDPASGTYGLLSVTSGTGLYSDLLGGAIAVTINDAAAGSNGPSLFTLTLDTPGATTGTFSGSGTLTVAQIADALNGNTYVNIRDSVFPSGELRGQISLLPEPASLALLAITGMLGMRRRV
jgi:hypothetical protein